MDWRKFVIALLCIAAAFALFWKHIDGGAMFLTLIGGSPLAAEAGRHLAAPSQPAVLDQSAPVATPAETGDTAGSPAP